MRVFGSGREAKEFFADKIVEQAKREGTPLSDLQQRMLRFTETAPDRQPEMLDWAGQIDDEIEPSEYEAKIAGLLKRAYEHDLGASKGVMVEDVKREYREAYGVLRKEDHYILIMVEAALGRKLKAFFGLI